MGKPNPRTDEVLNRLRKLGVWYEWSEPPNLVAAEVLQNAADAVRVKALCEDGAQSLITVWQPFAGLDTLAGKPPAPMIVAHTEADVHRAIVSHMSWLVSNEKHATKRVYLARLLRQQIDNFEGKRHERRRVG